MPASSDDTTRSAIAGILAWLIPGAGHFFLGYRAFGIIFFAAISFPYLAGLAIGGVANFVNPVTNRWLFLAELPVGGYTIPAYFASEAVEQRVLREAGLSRVPDPRNEPGAYDRYITLRSRYVAYYPGSDIATIYLAAAGLLNVLAILDAITRATKGGRPTYYRHLKDAAHAEAAS